MVGVFRWKRLNSWMIDACLFTVIRPKYIYTDQLVVVIHIDIYSQTLTLTSLLGFASNKSLSIIINTLLFTPTIKTLPLTILKQTNFYFNQRYKKPYFFDQSAIVIHYISFPSL